MCIAIYQPKGTEISDYTLETCWINNPDGMGLMYAKNGKIVVIKELKDFEKLLAAYQKARKCNPKSDFVLHFRIATSGKIDYENCHPFRINPQLAFCHNGIIDIETEKHINDTRTFMRKILRKLPENWLQNEGIVSLVEAFIDDSKMVFLDHKGKVSILNESAGIWESGVWYSNDSYKVNHWFGFDTPIANEKLAYYSTDICEICSTKLRVTEFKYCEFCEASFNHY